MAKPVSTSLPFWIMLLLVICLGGLALHFFTESLGSDGLLSSSSEVGGHYDDNFVLVNLPLSEVSHLLVQTNVEQPAFQRSFDQPPLLPPPNS